jgi:hypothetical protein
VNLPLVLAGVGPGATGGAHDALAPEGPAARWISGAFWTFTAVATVVLALVVLGVLAGIVRRRRPGDAGLPEVALPPSAHAPSARPVATPDGAQ